MLRIAHMIDLPGKFYRVSGESSQSYLPMIPFDVSRCQSHLSGLLYTQPILNNKLYVGPYHMGKPIDGS